LWVEQQGIISYTKAQSYVSGVTLQNGWYKGIKSGGSPLEKFDGGALAMEGFHRFAMNITISNTYFVSCKAKYGGAIYMSGGLAGSTLTITGSVFERNEAGALGGAIHMTYNATAWITATVFKQNEAQNACCTSSVCNHDFVIAGSLTSCGSGGALSITQRSTATITTSVFERNQAASSGAAIALREDSTAWITATILERNEALLDGGGLTCESRSTARITATVFKSNLAASAGCHIYTREAVEFYAYNVTFEPFDQQKSVSVSTPGSCEQHPCAPGESCSYTRFSLSCSPCPDGMVGLDNQICTTCPAGKGPAANKSACTACESNEVSTFGVCQPCSVGEPNPDKVSCQPCQPGYGGLGCGECLSGFYNRMRHYSGSNASCHACPAGGVCPGGQPDVAAAFAPQHHWIDEQRTPPGEGGPVVYACFSGHCTRINRGQPGCTANSSAGCCAEGHGGLLCESCSDGYIKQRDACIACTGAAWLPVLGMFGVKTAALLLVIAQILAKATTKSYTATTAFGTMIFTAQTAGLIVADSFQEELQSSASWLGGLVDVLQLVATPDQQAPEKCALPTTLFSKLFVEAVLQPAYAFAILMALSLPWHFAGLSCGLRGLCDAKRALSDRVVGKMQSKRLKVRWTRDGVLLKGTWARVAAKPAAGQNALAAMALRTVAMADCDPDHIFVSGSTLAASAVADYALLDERQLRRLLRSLSMDTTGRETKPEMLRHLRFHVDCDDSLFDNDKMPDKLQRYQITQACMHLLMYFFTPCTRALEVYWLCRSLAGSGDPNDPQPEYQETYLKDDMGYVCWRGAYLPVVITASTLWLAYAVAFPLALAWVIVKDKAAAGGRETADGGKASGGGGYWHSTRPLVEKFWFPLTAHLQPQYWWFFIIEFVRKLWVNLLYLRGYRADDGFNYPTWATLSLSADLYLNGLNNTAVAVIVRIFEHVQWRWAVSDITARG
jgi:hypothetical protein